MMNAIIEIEGLKVALDLPASVVRDLAVREYFARGGDAQYLYNFKVDSRSVVVDVGAHTGVWAEKMKADSPRIYLIEPIKAFQAALSEKFAGMDNVTIVPYGIGPSGLFEMKLEGDATAVLSKGRQADPAGVEIVRMEPFDFFLRSLSVSSIDVLQVNIEGAEYDFLDNIIETGAINRVRSLQVQFHPVGDESVARREGVRRSLSLTHREVFNFPFVWERWERC